MLIDVEGYTEKVIQLIHDKPIGEIVEIGNIAIALPKQPQKSEILFHLLPKKDQFWKRLDFPKDLLKIKSMESLLFYQVILNSGLINNYDFNKLLIS